MFTLLVLAAIAAPPTDRPQTRPLVVSPAAEPRPAMKHDLYTRVRDRTSGNAAIAYYRAISQRPTPPADPKQAQKEMDESDAWMTTDLDKFPVEEVKSYLQKYRSPLREVERGAIAERCDWEYLPRLRAEGISLLLPEIQECRTLARALALRTRLELAEGRFDDAAKSLRAGFQLAKNVGEGPTLIQLLVGLAIQSVFLERVEDWIARPGSPNLYWALTDLPRPLVDPRTSFQGEELFLEALIPSLSKLRGGPLPKDEAARIVDRAFTELRGSRWMMEGMSDASGSDRASTAEKMIAELGLVVYLSYAYEFARKELIGRGRPEAEVAKMAAAQVVFVNSYERFLELRDGQWKWLGVPYHQARAGLNESVKRLNAARAENRTDLFFTVFTMLFPATEKLMWSTARTERRVAMLRTLEAVRLHAAANDGNLPAKLADIMTVPIPDDPVTGKPFSYAVTATRFTLTASPPGDEKATLQNSVVYEVTLRGK